MEGAMKDNGFSLVPVRDRAAKIMRCNETTQKFGIKLSGNDALSLLAASERALKRSGRVEFEGGAVESLLSAFCDSPYLGQENFAETMEDIIDIFYEFKTDSLDGVDDAETIEMMKALFDGDCSGSADALRDEAARAARSIRSGAKDEKDDTGAEGVYDE
jgi:hypothetical protein